MSNLRNPDGSPAGDCTICFEPLTENDRDIESGWFSTDHWPCTCPTRSGRYVAIERGAALEDVHASRCFDHLPRAEREAFRLTYDNLRSSSRHLWDVVDRATGLVEVYAEQVYEDARAQERAILAG